MEDKRIEEVIVKIGDQSILAKKKDFSTGSKGYYGSGKVVVNGQMCQVSMNVVVIGSKNG